MREFAKLFDVHVDTVKNWQKRGILPDRRDQVNNYRVFTQKDVEKIKEMRLIKELGLKGKYE